MCGTSKSPVNKADSRRSDAGLDNVFSSRIQEPNYLPDKDVSNSDIVRKEPDRIHGLQTTKKFQQLLQQRCDTASLSGSQPSQRLGDILQTSCNPDNGGRNLLYPFLVMEAKSGKGGSNFDDIEVQTALPMRNSLVVQQNLQQIVPERVKVPGGPLAWFFANVGETWRVYGCYVTFKNDAKQHSWVSFSGPNISSIVDLYSEYHSSVGRQHHWA